jgi:hypothetical protein
MQDTRLNRLILRSFSTFVFVIFNGLRSGDMHMACHRWTAVTCAHFLIVGLKTDDQMNINSSHYRDNLQYIATGINIQCIATSYRLQDHLQCIATGLDLVYPFSIQQPGAHVMALFTWSQSVKEVVNWETVCHSKNIPKTLLVALGCSTLRCPLELFG